MKVILDLTETALNRLSDKASRKGRSRKKHMEIVLESEAARLTPQEKISAKIKSK